MVLPSRSEGEYVAAADGYGKPAAYRLAQRCFRAAHDDQQNNQAIEQESVFITEEAREDDQVHRNDQKVGASRKTSITHRAKRQNLLSRWT